MPKKTRTRAQKERIRSRREAAPPPTNIVPGAGAVAEPVAPARAVAPSMAPSTRRTPGRRTPTLTLNYGYLRRDITTLAVLGPLMVVLLVIADIVLR